MADSKEYTFSGQAGPAEPKPKDTDLDHDSPHHTLGRGPLQAAPGVHTHSASEIPDLPTGAAPHTHDYSTTYAAYAHTHPAVTNSDTVDNQHFNWDNREVVPYYFWGITNYGDGYLTRTAYFAAWNHTHDYAASGHAHGQTVRGGTYPGLTLAAGATGYVGIPNQMPFVPSGVAVSAFNDEGVQSIVCSVQSFDQTGIGVHCRNVGSGSETFDISWVAAAW
jgi:hypothetical protein